MEKYFSLTILIFSLSFIFPTFSFAQGMMENNNMMGGSIAKIRSSGVV